MTFLIGERYRETLEKGLSNAGAAAIWLPDNPSVDPRLAGHADLSVFMPDGNTIVAAEGLYNHIVNLLTNPTPVKKQTIRIYKGVKQSPEYPLDAGLCVCFTGKYSIFNPKTIDSIAKKHLTGVPIEVTQGYTKCCVSIVSNDTIITSDPVIRSRAVKAGMNVLLIRPGAIFLEGFEYGFIGGSTFLLDDHRMAFTGHLEDHPNKTEIIRFLAKHDVEPVFLTNRPIFDIGGAVGFSPP